MPVEKKHYRHSISVSRDNMNKSLFKNKKIKMRYRRCILCFLSVLSIILLCGYQGWLVKKLPRFKYDREDVAKTILRGKFNAAFQSEMLEKNRSHYVALLKTVYFPLTKICGKINSSGYPNLNHIVRVTNAFKATDQILQLAHRAAGHSNATISLGNSDIDMRPILATYDIREKVIWSENYLYVIDLYENIANYFIPGLSLMHNTYITMKLVHAAVYIRKVLTDFLDHFNTGVTITDFSISLDDYSELYDMSVPFVLEFIKLKTKSHPLPGYIDQEVTRLLTQILGVVLADDSKRLLDVHYIESYIALTKFFIFNVDLNENIPF